MDAEGSAPEVVVHLDPVRMPYHAPGRRIHFYCRDCGAYVYIEEHQPDGTSLAVCSECLLKYL